MKWSNWCLKIISSYSPVNAQCAGAAAVNAQLVQLKRFYLRLQWHSKKRAGRFKATAADLTESFSDISRYHRFLNENDLLFISPSCWSWHKGKIQFNKNCSWTWTLSLSVKIHWQTEPAELSSSSDGSEIYSEVTKHAYEQNRQNLLKTKVYMILIQKTLTQKIFKAQDYLREKWVVWRFDLMIQRRATGMATFNFDLKSRKTHLLDLNPEPFS